MYSKVAVVASVVALGVSLLSPVLVHREAAARYAQAGQDHAALCAIQQKNREDVVSSLQFNRDHPEGIPGITGKVIRQGIRKQANTVYVMQKHLRCGLPILPPLAKHLVGE